MGGSPWWPCWASLCRWAGQGHLYLYGDGAHLASAVVLMKPDETKRDGHRSLH